MTDKRIPIDDAKAAETELSPEDWARAEGAHERFKATIGSVSEGLAELWRLASERLEHIHELEAQLERWTTWASDNEDALNRCITNSAMHGTRYTGAPWPLTDDGEACGHD